MTSAPSSASPDPASAPQATLTDAERDACLLRLSQYSLDAPDAPMPFSKRLAEAEGWSTLFTLTVIEEYKRFAYLAVHAGHPVTPSEAIDAAWHLHLQYSKDYWTVFCADVLRAPLHHAPGIGAPDEDDTYARHYQQTLDSYRRTFGVEPPPDVWPPPPEQEDSTPEEYGRAWRPRNIAPPPPIAPVRRIMPLVWLAIGVGLIAVTTRAAPDVGVLDYPGLRFLAFYLGVCVIACLSIRGLHRFTYTRRPQGVALGSVPRALTPDEAALITGDASRMAQVATLALLDAGAIRIAYPSKKGRDRNIYVVANAEQAPERHVSAWAWLTRQKQHRSPWPSFRDQLINEASDMAARLQGQGWMWTSGSMRATTLAAWAIVLLVLGLGVAKVFVGLTRDRPVMWLLIEMVSFGFAYWWLTAQLAGVGSAGPTATADAALDAYRQRGQQASDASWSKTDLLWMTALGGTSVLVGTAWAGYRSMMGGPGMPVGSGGSGGDTSSSCSSSSGSSSSCSSSSCGSSGCGGCSSSS
ncbi:hypothetical protein PI87_19355 [Ralstonia sp. A12]|uniref:TIGR04222 domain-containing membrane protein n=1 Tax=Ralstonia sp. A12 TaxID=1217052 RepID=UPI000574F8F5|nr:TIGR04222 domain-containing membrane protein [Ralstonia sp. A12]KHK52928.1 hypothetical protein PI87_19355 [Ralstonia sp. A12]